MGALLSTIRGILNCLLPFTNPETSLVQNLIHSAILFGTLYYAPQIAEYYHALRASIPPEQDYTRSDSTDEELADRTPPLADNLELQPDTDAEDAIPPPFAPTPPPAHQAAATPPPALPLDDIDANLNPDAGPADHPRPTPQNRHVGAKKAKSLARRDQRRAYHEFHRSQAEERKRLEAEGREEREAALAAEKARRAEAERAIVERERRERERRKEEERREAEEERGRRERAVEVVRRELRERGAVALVDVAWAEGKDRVWIERLVRASGLLVQRTAGGGMVMITGDGWLVEITTELMRQAYADAVKFGEARDGTVSFMDFGSILERVVQNRAAATA